MAKDGSFQGSTNNKYIQSRIDWKSTPNVAGNYSDVEAALWYRRTNSGYTTSGTINCSININGNTASTSKQISIGTSWVQAFYRKVRVSHNNDGTKRCWIGGSGGISGTSFTSTSVGATVTLDTIARASSFSMSTNTTVAGESFTITINPQNNSFSHTIRFMFGNGKTKNYNVAAGTRTVSVASEKSWVTEFPNAASGVGAIHLYTMDGSTQVGDTWQYFYLNVPSDVKPTVGTPTFTDSNGIYEKLGTYAINYPINVNVPASVYNDDFADTATLKSVTATYNGNTYDASSGSFTFTPTTAGTSDMSISATDSRGTKSDTYTKSITVKAYAKPTVTISASRCDESGDLDDTGKYANVTIQVALDTTNMSENAATVNLQYRAVGTTTWTTVNFGTISSSQTLTKIINVDDTKSYELQATITDSITSTSSAMTLSNGEVPLDFYKGGKGIAIGKTATQNGFEINWKMFGAGVLNATYPVGAIYMSLSNTSPAELFGGTWERIVNKFLLASTPWEKIANENDSFTCQKDTLFRFGANGKYVYFTKPAGTYTASCAGLGVEDPINGTVKELDYFDDNFLDNEGDYDTGSEGGNGVYNLSVHGLPSHAHEPSGNTMMYDGTSSYANSKLASTGTNTLGGYGYMKGRGYGEHYTGNTGDGRAYNVMPPFLAVNIWKRTA